MGTEGSKFENETEETRRAICCHEAGLAVARVLNGDTVLLMVSNPRAEMTAAQKALYHSGDRIEGERGNVMARCKEQTCNGCGRGTVRNRSNPIMSDFWVNLACVGCEEIVVDELACWFAGGVATLQLMPERHDNVDLMADIPAIIRIVEGLGQRRGAILKRAVARAHNWIQHESQAVLALADALFDAVVLEGEEVERIVRANLNQTI